VLEVTFSPSTQITIVGVHSYTDDHEVAVVVADDFRWRVRYWWDLTDGNVFFVATDKLSNAVQRSSSLRLDHPVARAIADEISRSSL
jgi:hypothetical protein